MDTNDLLLAILVVLVWLGLGIERLIRGLAHFHNVWLDRQAR